MAKKSVSSKTFKLSGIGEFGLIKKIRRTCADNVPQLLAGIGDDAAAVETGNKKKLLVTSDMLIDGVHFDLSFTTFYQLGYKFLGVNISDILAMGGQPDYFLVNLGIPADFRTVSIEELYAGIMKISKKFGVTVIGGDTCASKCGLVLSGTLIGSSGKIIRRSGAREGDGIYVTDTLGDSAMGLQLLKKRNRKIQKLSSSAPGPRLMKKHLMPEPAPLKDTSRITSMIDISDGLLADLSHICDESRVGAIIYSTKIPVSRDLAATARKLGSDPLEYALKGGEDYALLFTAPRDLKTKAARIGEIVKAGRLIVDDKGIRRRFKAEGYEHFKR